MGTEKAYIYGSHNGAEYEETKGQKRTHWDPRVEVTAFDFGLVQVGVVPPSDEHSTPTHGAWISDDGQFLSLDRSGLNRLIESLQEAGAATFGRDRW